VLFYCENLENDSAVLAGEESHHLIKVLRIRIGESVKLFNGKGITAIGTVSRITKDKVEIALGSIEIHAPKERGRVVIAASVAKGERYDWLVGKCTELGVDRICPVLFERTVKQASGHSIERYNKLALSAAKQCERPFLPVIEQPARLEECLNQIKKDFAEASLLFGSMDEKAVSIFAAINEPWKDHAVFIGPEGGITQVEEDILKNAGAVGVRLTDTILRTETAAESFAAILCSVKFAGWLE
jgi:16S rRNA (uracil1498-N3)-methyltransferase